MYTVVLIISITSIIKGIYGAIASYAVRGIQFARVLVLVSQARSGGASYSLQEYDTVRNSLYSSTAAMQHNTTHCNTRQRTATDGNTLQHSATHCNTMKKIATQCAEQLVSILLSYLYMYIYIYIYVCIYIYIY